VAFLFLAFVFLGLQVVFALLAIGLGFAPIYVWWLFVPMIFCLIGWRVTRHNLRSYRGESRED
jgi:hypothetical protein